jgi:hypothetical protein
MLGFFKITLIAYYYSSVFYHISSVIIEYEELKQFVGNSYEGLLTLL